MLSEAWLATPLLVMVLHRAAVELAARRRPAAAACNRDVPPVSWLRTIKPGVPDLGSKLERFIAAVKPGDEVILGVDAGSQEEALCRVLAQGRESVKVVPCERGAAANPKVAKLLAMAPCARHEHWIVADTEALIAAEFAEAFRREWSAGGAAALTAGYRFGAMKTWPQWLDALAVVQTLWPGLELVRAFGRLHFTLGACTGVRRSDVEAIGGWAALGAELAEDRQLGVLLADSGRTVRLSDAVLELEVDPIGWRDYWRHQRRVAVTYRAATPAGAFGMILTRGFTLSLIGAAVCPGIVALACTVAAAALHITTVAAQARRIGARLGGRVWLSLIADFVETVCWTLGWFSKGVWWGGKWRLITWRGQIGDNGSEAGK